MGQHPHWAGQPLTGMAYDRIVHGLFKGDSWVPEVVGAPKLGDGPTAC